VIPDLQRPILTIENGIPSPLIKWAEESYVLAAVDATALQSPSQTRELLLLASELLAASDSCEPKGRVGLIGMDLSLQLHCLQYNLIEHTNSGCAAYTPQSWDLVAAVLQDIPGIQAAVLYAAVEEIPNLGTTAVPTVQHLAGKAQVPLQRSKNFIAYDYPGASTSAFAVPFHPGFNYNADAISHSRNLMFLKEKMGGPYFDLEQIWDEHTYYEFENRSVEHTMSTMVQEPYVNHIPTVGMPCPVYCGF
jgi:carboxymethylenebutenolidase